jgi:hypothetical protein
MNSWWLGTKCNAALAKMRSAFSTGRQDSISCLTNWAMASARDSKHIVGQIKTDDRRARKGRGQQFRAVARTTAKVEDAAGVERRNLRHKITRRPRALVKTDRRCRWTEVDP